MKYSLKLSIFLSFALVLFLNPTAEAKKKPRAAKSIPCQTSCPGGGGWGSVVANMAERCMCIGSKCFKIDIGSGSTFTYNGSGTITANVDGTRYQTVSTPTTGYDKDAMKMGIFRNNTVGKWIHKTNGCTAGGEKRTIGCIGVPCDMWPLMRRQKGKTLVVCGGVKNPDSAAENKRKVLAEDAAQAAYAAKQKQGKTKRATRSDSVDEEESARR